MAVLDLERDVVVIRIVYDGPPYAGKTTSVRALGSSLSRSVDTPREAAGRTMYFDWMEYTGGLFEGHQIRCQIVSVPGQPDLAARRRALLESADVVVFVADASDRAMVDRSIGHITQMVEILRDVPGPPVGVIVQANKQDLPGALTRAQLRDVLGIDFARTAVTESIADQGAGVRETFVLAVRLALDRTRELMNRGELPSGKPSVNTAEELLSALEGLSVATPRLADAEQRAAEHAAASAEPVPAELVAAVAAIAPVDDAWSSDEPAPAPAPAIAPAPVAPPAPKPTSSRPRLPDARAASGAIWPPVEGRLVLHDAMSSELTVHKVGDGDWIAGIGSGWRIHSGAWATFEQLEDGRQALLGWARVHAQHTDLLSTWRCLVLSESGHDTWRMWQIVKLTPSLRAWLVDAADLDPPQLLARLTQAAALLADGYAKCADTQLLPTLDTIGRGERGAQFVALMPAPTAALAPRARDVPASIARELARILSAELVEQRAELRAIASLPSDAPTPWDELVAAALADRPPMASLALR